MRLTFGFRSWLVIAGALVFGAGAGAGFFVRGYLGDDVGDSFNETQPASGALPLKVDNKMVYDAIGLDPSKRAEADRILANHFQIVKRLREERIEVGQKVQKDILDLLEPEQRDHMGAIIQGFKFDQVADRVAPKVAMYKAELKLNQQQEDAFNAIFFTDQLAKDDAFRECKGSREELGKRFEKLNEERALKVRPILGDEQWDRFQKMERDKRSWLERGPRGGGWGPRRPEPGHADGKRPEPGAAGAELKADLAPVQKPPP